MVEVRALRHFWIVPFFLSYTHSAIHKNARAG